MSANREDAMKAAADGKRGAPHPHDLPGHPGLGPPGGHGAPPHPLFSPTNPGMPTTLTSYTYYRVTRMVVEKVMLTSNLELHFSISL